MSSATTKPPPIQLRLAHAPNLAAFLSEELVDGRRSRKPDEPGISCAEFARKAGFASRSYPREVRLGHKKITSKTLPRFVAAFGLKGDAAKLFRCLALLDNPALGLGNLSAVQIEALATQLRGRILARKSAPVTIEDTAVYVNRMWPYVFTALGSEAAGSTLEMIGQRLGISLDSVTRIIEDLQSKGRVEWKGERVHPIQERLVYRQKDERGDFKSFFLDTLQDAEKRAKARFHSEEDLFFNSVFAIPPEQAGEFKRQLRELLLKFVHEIEAPDGESISTLVCSLTHGIRG